jgi:hypothetical protein
MWWMAIFLSVYAALMTCAIQRGFCRRQAVIICALAAVSGLALWIQLAGGWFGLLVFALLFVAAWRLAVRFTARLWPVPSA